MYVQVWSVVYSYIADLLSQWTIECVTLRNSLLCVSVGAGKTKDDRQAGRHKPASEGRDGPLQENDGQTETEQTAVPKGKGGNAGGGRDFFSFLIFCLLSARNTVCSSPQFVFSLHFLRISAALLFMCALSLVDRRPAPRAGAFAHVQAGDGAAWTRSELFLRTGGLQQQQDQGGGAGAWSQAAQAGRDEIFPQYHFWSMCEELKHSDDGQMNVSAGGNTQVRLNRILKTL